jgi:hypothetical protein
MFRKLTIIIIFVSVYVEGLLAAHAQDLGVVPGSLFVLMSIFALTTLVGASAYYREDGVVYELTNTPKALISGDVFEVGDDDVEVETPEPYTFTDISLLDEEVVKDEAVDVEVVEDTDTDFTDTITLKLPEIDVEKADKELEEALNEEIPEEPTWAKEPKEASAETDKMINELFKDVDSDGLPKLDPDVKVQSYTLEESVIEDEYTPVPEDANVEKSM